MTAFNAATMLGTIPMVMLATRLKNYRMMLLISMAHHVCGTGFYPGGQRQSVPLDRVDRQFIFARRLFFHR